MSFTNIQLFQQGTWADLYLADMVETGQKVVIKKLRPAADPSIKRAFLRELRIVTKAIHHRVLRALFHRNDALETYYVMPYFPRGPLTPHAGRLTHEQLRAAAKQICEGVAAMHAVDIVHGDVKPDNMMVTAEGNLQVSDPLGNGAGCTIMISENSGGTPGYWAPELAGGRSAMSKEGDVFSIGATIYHLATGRRPEDGNSLDPWAAGVLVPADLRQIILAAVRQTASARPTVGQLLRAIDGNVAALSEPAGQIRALGSAPSNDLGKALLAIGGLVLLAKVLDSVFSSS